MISAVNNIMGLASARALAEGQQAISRAAERLATGKRINRAADDPAGMIASEKLTVEERQITEKIDAYELELHRLAARDGAMSVIGDLLLELNGLVVTAANRDGLSKAEREALQIEAEGILDAIDYIGSTTTFNGEQVIDEFTGRMGIVSRESQDEQGNPVTETFGLASLRGGGALNLVSGDLGLAQEAAKLAVNANASGRAALGTGMKRLESGISSLALKLSSVSEVKSQILDTDFAAEVSSLMRSRVREQASLMATGFAANHQRETVLSLLGG